MVAHINGFHGEIDVDGTRWFGRYRLVEFLGRDGMGEVWRAFDPHGDLLVVLRMLPAKCAAEPGYPARFRRDAAAAAGITQPHAVPIHDFGEIDRRLFVATRLIEGRGLHAVLDDGPLTPARAVWIIEQIASALHAAHEVGLVHSNVKPASILIAEDDFAYLGDFGIVTAESGLTNTGASGAADWAYMAPERFRNGTADVRSDVYGLACVLYQSLTGQPPFAGEGRDQLAAHMFKPPPLPSTIRAGIPPAMNLVVANGMAKEPDRRYPTTKHLAKAARVALSAPIRPSTSSVASLTRAAKVAAPTPPSSKNGGYRPRHASRHNRAATVRTSATTTTPSVGHPLPKWVNITFAAITISAVSAFVLGIIIMGHLAFRDSGASPKPTEPAQSVAPSPEPPHPRRWLDTYTRAPDPDAAG
jgi:serine/threonine protein kinase